MLRCTKNSFCCKVAKGDTFDICQLKTPQGKTLNATKNGEPVLDSETGQSKNLFRIEQSK